MSDREAKATGLVLKAAGPWGHEKLRREVGKGWKFIECRGYNGVNKGGTLAEEAGQCGFSNVRGGLRLTGKEDAVRTKAGG